MMRALTLTQPWAGLVASGIKLVENRPRRAPATLIGQRFAIHASRAIDEDVYARIMDIDSDHRLTKLDYGDGMIAQVIPTDARWYRLSRITSAVIAVATLDREVHTSGPDNCPLEADGSVAVDLAGQYRWFFGPIGYVLRDVVALPTPVPCKGALGFWSLSDEVERAVVEQLAKERTAQRSLLGKMMP